MVNVKIGVIPLSVKLDFVLGTVFKEVEEYNLINVEVTDTLMYWDTVKKLKCK